MAQSFEVLSSLNICRSRIGIRMGTGPFRSSWVLVYGPLRKQHTSAQDSALLFWQ